MATNKCIGDVREEMPPTPPTWDLHEFVNYLENSLYDESNHERNRELVQGTKVPCDMQKSDGPQSSDESYEFESQAQDQEENEHELKHGAESSQGMQDYKISHDEDKGMEGKEEGEPHDPDEHNSPQCSRPTVYKTLPSQPLWIYGQRG